MSLDIKEKIIPVDWSKYSGPEYYDPKELVESLIHLSSHNESKAKHGLDHKVLSAVGNDHCWHLLSCYSSRQQTCSLKWSSSSELEQVRKCAYCILNSLYYFQPDVSNYKDHSYEHILLFVREKLSDYSD